MTRTTRKLAGGATAIMENGKVVEIVRDTSPVAAVRQSGGATYLRQTRTDQGGCQVCRGDRHPTPRDFTCPDCRADIDGWMDGTI